ncbi:mobile element protein [Agrilactobacillus composti DSM 18527 = JCM 14202]|nr:RNA-guided endonuclease TnpB family protein [Agrilactobacillus composti]GAF38951.1 mobile element protein [Agrilactobacillus composti DSM 18527 = JCM 14202]
MPVKTHKIRCYPNAEMRTVIAELMDYNRFCWNQGLATWNDMYEASLIMNDKKIRPSERSVRNELVQNKADWQYQRSARVLQTAIHRLRQAWQNFFNPNMPDARKPKFHSKRDPKQSFTTDRATVNGKFLTLDRPHGSKHRFTAIKLAETLRFSGAIKTVTITKRGDKFYASIAVSVADMPRPAFYESWDIAGIDLNVGHINWNDGEVNTFTPRMAVLHQRIKVYQKRLARKRRDNPRHFRSKNYQRIQAKLNRTYQKINALQDDLIHKFSQQITQSYAVLCIEDLNVRSMKMAKNKVKNLQRSLFRRLRTAIEYKAAWQHRHVVIADRFFPSTQRCSNCGFIKTADSHGGKMTLRGDSIYHDHDTYRCYECGMVMNRDENAVQNLIAYAAGLSPERVTVH